MPTDEEIKDLGTLKSSPDGTEIVPIQEAAGGTGSSKHTTVLAIASFQATVPITAAEFLTINSGTPIELVPAPGAGYGILARSFSSIRFDFVTAWYSQPDVDLTYDGDTNHLANSGMTWLGGVTSPQSTFFTDTVLNTAFEGALSEIDNKPLLLGGTNANPDPVRLAAIATSSIASAGADYAPGDTGTFDINDFTPAAYVVDTVDGLGAVLTYHLSFAGDPAYAVGGVYNAAPGGGQPGIGSGLQVQVNTIAAGANDGSFVYSQPYTIVALT